ncbi:MAG: aminotransferase class I/II-fold pyridoxal phosphate-dependent enzyme, partial [bacterium]|nr:aminotransferase class I/II-fold pyridoxal phosphate-dependent enzyme [bacterium]
MPVPFIDLRRFETDFLDRWAEKCREITANTRFVGGPEATRLEETLARENQVAAAVGCANGTDALQLALRAAGVDPGDRVVIPDTTFWATFEAVINCGAFPVTVDVDDDLQMDFDLFRRAVEEHRPHAVILVHLYGWGSARLDEFRTFCRERRLPLIEDGAQAYGVTWQGESIFKDAFLATLSFYPAKVVGACGDAGAVLCATPELAEKVRSLGNHGRASHYGHARVGWNSRLGGFEAAYLNLVLEYLPQRLESRRRMAALYRQRLAELGVRSAGPPDGYLENGYLNVTLLEPERRPAIEAALKEAGIGFANTYPSPISKQPGAADWLSRMVGGERSETLSRSVL